MDTTIQTSLFEGINGATPADDIALQIGAVVEPPQSSKHREDRALFYDCLIHGSLAVGDTLYLYEDGTFEKVKHGK